MSSSDRILKIKNTLDIWSFIIAFCLFPIVFFATLNYCDGQILLTSFVTLFIYLLISLYFIWQLKRNQDVYAIEADSQSIRISGHGTFHWKEIATIGCFVARHYRSFRKHLTFTFHDGRTITLNASNFDMDYIEIRNQLEALKSQ